MKRFHAGVLLGALATVLLAVPAPAVAAQEGEPSFCLPGEPEYPPAPPPLYEDDAGLVEGDFLVTGTFAELTVVGLDPDIEVCGILYSDPIDLGATITTGDGRATWTTDDEEMAEFELNQLHRLDVYRDGFLIAELPFCALRTGPGVGRAAPPSACNTGTTTGNNTDGNNTDGNNTDGNNTDGNNTDGNNTDGNNTDGNNTDGNNTDGNNTDGNNTGGDPTGGDPTGGDPTGGDPTGGDPTGGDPTGGDPTGGDPTGGDPTGGDPTGGTVTAGGTVTGGATVGVEATAGVSRIPQVLGNRVVPGSGSLAKTGLDHLLGLLKLAAVAIGIGALLRYSGRRRASTFPV